MSTPIKCIKREVVEKNERYWVVREYYAACAEAEATAFAMPEDVAWVSRELWTHPGGVRDE